MRIAAARLHPYRLPLRRPWVAAAATLTERCGWLVELSAADGTAGWGDCAPLPSSPAASQVRVQAALAAAVRDLPGRDEGDILDRLPAPAPPEVRWALETAQLDLVARRRGVPLARHLGAAGLTVAVNAALGPLDTTCAERALAAAEQGYAVAKIKVGLAAVDAELQRLHALATQTDGRLRLRLDANRAWPEPEAWRFLTAAAALPIDGVEEPLAAPTPAALARLQAALPFALAVDESLTELGLDALLAARAVRRLVVKPARAGGFAATRHLAQHAAAAGIELVITSVVDSAVGVAAAAHLAAALPPPSAARPGAAPSPPPWAHGLATGPWLAVDVAPPLPLRAGHLHLPDLPGLGVTPQRP